MEHHANIVPWLMLKDQIGIELRWVELTSEGHLDLDRLDELVDGVKVVSITAMSNVLGTIPPVRRIADAAHAAGALVVVDAAQYVPHLPTDVEALGADFVGFTGHKMLGPTGIGVLWGREDLLELTPPFLGGGEMIRDVRLDGFETNEIPWKFEAGTPPIAEAIGLGAAVDYLDALDADAMIAHEHDLTRYATEQLTRIDGLRLIGTAAEKVGVLSFTLEGIHPYDMAPVLDHEGVAVRTGHHCAQPVMDRFAIPATVRASIAFYNTRQDIDALVAALAKVKRMFSGL
jgi:cysteine desulfurase/selenocysteine lyase